ncbi:MAG: hypothetical protein J5779_01595, partial [Clostridia bacterium]|nr:hypothetical protein [Clostridia bacterium]
SNLISKKIYSLYEGIFVGTIINLKIENFKLKGVYVLSLDEETIYFVSSNDIFSFGEHAANIKNISKLQNESLQESSFVGKQVVSVLGEECGNVIDVFFDEKFNLTSIQTDLNIVIPRAKISSVGADAIFFGQDKICLKRFKPKFSFNLNLKEDYKVSTLESHKNVLAKIEDKQNMPTIPQKVKQNPNFLIGRKVSSSIKNEFGENIIKEGQKITEKVISKAQLSNKIYELSRCVN